MSNEQAAKVAIDQQSPVTPALVQDNGKVVQFTAGDYHKHPLTQEAFDLYYSEIDSSFDEETGRTHWIVRRHFLPLEAVQAIAGALERQVGIDDLNKLVGPDGDRAKSYGTNEEFQPFWWTFVNRRFVDEVRRLKSIPDDWVIDGCFFPHPDRRVEEFISFSGHPFYWNRERGDNVAFWTNLVKAVKASDQYGMPRARCEAIISERAARRQQEEGLTTALSDFFGGNTKNQTGRDRRQFKRS